MSSTPTARLSDGHTIPQLGLGTWPMDDEQAQMAVLEALELGYRLIDTAARYGNETGVGRALSSTDISREDIVVTTKLRGAQHGYQQALAGFDESRRRLGVDHVDLFLIHWPLPSRNQYVDTWRALCQLQQDGLARSIGVSNFTQAHIERLAAETGIWPAVVVIPKSSSPVRMASNLNVFDFSLTEEDMSALSALDRGHRLGGDPDSYIEL